MSTQPAKSRQNLARSSLDHPPLQRSCFPLSPASGSQGQTTSTISQTSPEQPVKRARGPLPYAKGRTLHTIRRALTQPSRSGTHSKENAIQSSIVTVVKQQARSANTRRAVRYIHEEGKGCQRQQKRCWRRRQQIARLGK